MQVGVNVICMHTNFSGPGLSGFEDILLKFGQISLSDHGLYSPWGSKNKSIQKFYASTCKCIHAWHYTSAQ